MNNGTTEKNMTLLNNLHHA